MIGPSGYVSGGGPPLMDEGGAFMSHPGEMVPPPPMGTFDADMARPMTPMAPITVGGYEPGIGEGPLGDHFVSAMAEERGLMADEPPMMSAGPSMMADEPPMMSVGHTGPLDDDEYLGMDPDIRGEGTLHGVYRDDYARRQSMLTEPLPGGMIPNAATELPPMYHGGALERRFPGGNESMPEGAIGYVGHDEPATWGTSFGPQLYPADHVDDEWVSAVERSPDWGPAEDYLSSKYDEDLRPSRMHQIL